MPSYTSFLVLALAASAVSPVRCAESPQIQIKDREHTPSRAPSVERGFDPSHPMVLGLGISVVLFAISIGIARHNAAKRPPTTTTAGPSTYVPQQINPPKPFVGQQERPGIYSGLPADTATYSSETRFVNNRDRRTSSSLDLLSRADLDEALILSSRKLDKLD